jgi:hypothetical protein
MRRDKAIKKAITGPSGGHPVGLPIPFYRNSWRSVHASLAASRVATACRSRRNCRCSPGVRHRWPRSRAIASPLLAGNGNDDDDDDDDDDEEEEEEEVEAARDEAHFFEGTAAR